MFSACAYSGTDVVPVPIPDSGATRTPYRGWPGSVYEKCCKINKLLEHSPFLVLWHYLHSMKCICFIKMAMNNFRPLFQSSSSVPLNIVALSNALATALARASSVSGAAGNRLYLHYILLQPRRRAPQGKNNITS